MIQYSQQHRIINGICTTFRNKQTSPIFTKTSDQALQKDRMFYNPGKYEAMPLTDFKFLVLWTVFKNNSNKINTLQTLKDYTKEEIRDIQTQKNKVLTYKNTFAEDIDFCKSKIITPKNVLEMYRKNQISIFGAYYFLNNLDDLSRLQKRKLEQMTIFLSYFEAIKSYIDLY